MRHKGLSKPWWRHLNPFAPFDEGEAQYLAFKYQGLHESHMYACLAIIACTVVFATIYWGDQYLEDTIFPQVLGTRPHPCPLSPDLALALALPTARCPLVALTTDSNH